ncbi:MAG: hypothetical protein BECKG1743D_GA0114223_104963 [Candidatus Kentron sp. G]|nr:MAG: hypothetical protein BECKG1743D_GA0114223_104963 [Candidatus Kentron sp. G]
MRLPRALNPDENPAQFGIFFSANRLIRPEALFDCSWSGLSLRHRPPAHGKNRRSGSNLLSRIYPQALPVKSLHLPLSGAWLRITTTLTC